MWLFSYLAFVVFAIFISYYLNAQPPSTTTLNQAKYIASDINHPKNLQKSLLTAVTLPDMKTAELKGRTEGWYIIPIPQGKESFYASRLCVYLPVVNQNVEVFLNEKWLGNGGRMESPVDRNFNRPLIYNFDRNDLAEKNNVFYIHVKGLLPRWTYLGEVYIAPEAILYPVYEKQKILRVNLIVFTSIALVFTSLFTAILWLLRRRKKETYYLWYSFAELLWAVHDSNLFIRRILVPDSLWESIVILSIGWSIISFILFFHRYTGDYSEKMDRVIFWFGIAFTLPFAYQDFEWVVFYGYQVWMMYILSVGFYGAIFLLQGYVRTRNKNLLVMLFAGTVMIAFGLHDLLATLAILPPSSPYIMPTSALLIILVISSLLIRRLVESLEIVEHYNESLRETILLREKQLRQEYQKTQQLQKRQILNDERERIMRDIHDGIGGHLVTTLASIESPDATMPQVKENLTIALQDLRMVIDSLDGESQELTVILGTLRIRLEGLLRQANIKLIWQVQDLPMMVEFGPEKALNTMRIVQEAITNVIKHSGASELVISAYPEMVEGEKIAVVSIADNGCGFSKSMQRGRGMDNMKKRASQIDARFDASPNTDTGMVIKLFFSS